MYTEAFIKKGFQFREEIEENIVKGNYMQAKELLDRNFDNYEYDIQWCILKAILKFADGDYQTGKDILLEKYPQHEWNLEINYNLAIICYELKEIKNTIKYYVRCLWSEQLTEELRYEIGNMLERMCKEDNKVLKYCKYYKSQEQLIMNNEYKNFPLKGISFNGDSGSNSNDLIGKKFNISNVDYYSAVNDRYFQERDGVSFHKLNIGRIGMLFYKTEILKGKKLLDFHFSAKEKTVIPIMPLKANQKISIKSDDIKLDLTQLLEEWYYYTFEKGSQIEINSEDYLIIGEPIILMSYDNNPRIILNLFIDGLSAKYLDELGFEKLMPRTFKFFKEGSICKNAFSVAEWTAPSLASIFTGNYTLGNNGHRIFQSKFSSNNLHKKELFPEILQEERYFCAKIDGDWRSTPNSGYAKGMDRILYQPSIRAMHGDEVILDTIEHLEAFKECNNFVWLCIPDLHDIADEYEGTISTQIGTDLRYREIKHTESTSVQKKFDEAKKMRYKAQLKKIDNLLDIIYSYVEKNYKEEDYLISLMSDHGQGYLLPEGSEFLDEYRNKIAMMYRGRNIPKGFCEEFMESIDLFPTILHCAKINNFDLKEGNIPKWFGGNKSRDYSFTESIFPKSPYYAAINDDKYKFFFTTVKECSAEGYLDISEYTVKLIERSSEKDITDQRQDIVNKYKDIVINHIKEYIECI